MRDYAPVKVESFDYAKFRDEMQLKAYETPTALKPLYKDWLEKYRKKKRPEIPVPRDNLRSDRSLDVGNYMGSSYSGSKNYRLS